MKINISLNKYNTIDFYIFDDVEYGGDLLAKGWYNKVYNYAVVSELATSNCDIGLLEEMIELIKDTLYWKK